MYFVSPLVAMYIVHTFEAQNILKIL